MICNSVTLMTFPLLSVSVNGVPTANAERRTRPAATLCPRIPSVSVGGLKRADRDVKSRAISRSISALARVGPYARSAQMGGRGATPGHRSGAPPPGLGPAPTTRPPSSGGRGSPSRGRRRYAARSTTASARFRAPAASRPMGAIAAGALSGAATPNRIRCGPDRRAMGGRSAADKQRPRV
jgi:hypothetical protein